MSGEPGESAALRPGESAGLQPDAGLSLVLRQQRRTLDELGLMRAGIGVMMAILQRLDGTVAGLVNEIRATHAQQSRLEQRVRELEAEAP